MPFTKHAIKKAVKGIRRRATGFVLLAILFLGIGVLQYIFVNHQIRKTTTSELSGWASEIAKEIYNGNKWDLTNYRRVFIPAPSWYVFTKDGLMVDNEAPFPKLLNLFRIVKVPTNLTFEVPEIIASEIGEKWRLLGKKVRGGVVIVGLEGASNVECAECDNQQLVTNLARFGPTLEKAAALSSRELDENIEYAVVSDSGEFKAGWGGVPLKIDPTAILAAANAGKPISVGSQTYLLISKSIIDSNNKVVGTIVIPGEITLEQRALDEQWKFNLVLSATAFAVAVLIALYFISREIIRSPHFETLPEALNSPENLRKEFKGSFQWDIGRSCKNLEERLKTLKTIVAFLNSEGGVLFIGANDNRTVRGIKEDLELFDGSTDKFLLQIRDLISDRIGAEFAPLIKTRCESAENKIVCVVEVEKATQPAFLKEDRDNKNHFYTREDNRTKELDPKEAVAVIQTRRQND